MYYYLLRISCAYCFNGIDQVVLVLQNLRLVLTFSWNLWSSASDSKVCSNNVSRQNMHVSFYPWHCRVACFWEPLESLEGIFLMHTASCGHCSNGEKVEMANCLQQPPSNNTYYFDSNHHAFAYTPEGDKTKDNLTLLAGKNIRCPRIFVHNLFHHRQTSVKPGMEDRQWKIGFLERTTIGGLCQERCPCLVLWCVSV